MKKAQKMPTPIMPEFSREIALDKITNTPFVYHIQADFKECQALAKRFGVAAINQLEASFTITQGVSGKLFEVDGHIHAKINQECIVSLEEFSTALSFPIRLILRNYGKDDLQTLDYNLNLDEEDVEDLRGKSVFDLGEIAAQYLSLAIDPYPRSPTAELQNKPAQTDSYNPFQKLKDFQKK